MPLFEKKCEKNREKLKPLSMSFTEDPAERNKLTLEGENIVP